MGRSVHNQRIERLSRDLFTGCVSYFYYLFYHLKGQTLLDPENNADIMALQLTFLPKLQQQLDSARRVVPSSPSNRAQPDTSSALATRNVRD